MFPRTYRHCLRTRMGTVLFSREGLYVRDRIALELKMHDRSGQVVYKLFQRHVHKLEAAYET